MISSTFFFTCFFLICKDSVILNDFFDISPFNIFITSICGIVLYLILESSFGSNDSSTRKLFFFLFFLIVFLRVLCFLSHRLFKFIVLFEATMFPMIYLIISYSKDLDKISSCFFILCINLLGSVPFIIFSGYFKPMGESSLQCSLSPICSLLSFLCCMLVLLCKIPVFIRHFWLTKAHVSASAPCSIYLASLILKLGSMGFFKFVPHFKISSSLSYFVFSFSIVGLLFFTFNIIRFLDMKILVACSSILHISLVFPGFSVISFSSLNFCFLILIGHGLCSFILFYMLGLLYESNHNRRSDFLKSAERENKSISMVFFLYLLLNLGFPPFIGFYSELFLCKTLITHRFLMITLFCCTIILFAIFFFFSISKLMFSKKSVKPFSSRMHIKIDSWFFLSFYFLVLSLLYPFSLNQNLVLWRQNSKG